MENNVLLDSQALTKIQSISILAIVLVAALGSSVYFLVNQPEQSSDTIKIGILADLDNVRGKQIWKGAKLAVEQINAEGGMLGKKIDLIGEDHNLESGADMVEVNTALTRLISIHNVDFIIGQTSNEIGFGVQDKISENRIIFASSGAGADSLSQRVIDEYDKFKYYFSLSFNQSSAFWGMSDVLSYFKDNTDLRKIGFISIDVEGTTSLIDEMDTYLTEVYGFDTVYKAAYPPETFDFSSYFATAEAAGVEILIPWVLGDEGIPFIKEWADRQCPMVIASGYLVMATFTECWEWTDGKCEAIATTNFPISTGYPLTSKTIPVRNAYITRWDETPNIAAGMVYDFVRFILFDAVERAGTIDSDAVVEALEETSVETTSAKNFVFTDSHGLMVGENVNDPDADYILPMSFQWQNGELVPVYPEKIRLEAGATYTYPPWPGPWDDLD
jgi:branched-chain amino acid transport system substrate-binding protein